MIGIEESFELVSLVYYYLFGSTLTNKIHFPDKIW